MPACVWCTADDLTPLPSHIPDVALGESPGGPVPTLPPLIPWIFTAAPSPPRTPLAAQSHLCLLEKLCDGTVLLTPQRWPWCPRAGGDREQEGEEGSREEQAGAGEAQGEEELRGWERAASAAGTMDGRGEEAWAGSEGAQGGRLGRGDGRGQGGRGSTSLLPSWIPQVTWQMFLCFSGGRPPALQLADNAVGRGPLPPLLTLTNNPEGITQSPAVGALCSCQA